LNSFGEASEISLPFPERFLVVTGEELRRLGADYRDRLKPYCRPCPVTGSASLISCW
jgi:hypothetical protein